MNIHQIDPKFGYDQKNMIKLIDFNRKLPEKNHFQTKKFLFKNSKCWPIVKVANCQKKFLFYFQKLWIKNMQNLSQSRIENS